MSFLEKIFGDEKPDDRKSSTPMGDHKIGENGVCLICGCTQSAIQAFGWNCKASKRDARRSVGKSTLTSQSQPTSSSTFSSDEAVAAKPHWFLVESRAKEFRQLVIEIPAGLGTATKHGFIFLGEQFYDIITNTEALGFIRLDNYPDPLLLIRVDGGVAKFRSCPIRIAFNFCRMSSSGLVAVILDVLHSGERKQFERVYGLDASYIKSLLTDAMTGTVLKICFAEGKDTGKTSGGIFSTAALEGRFDVLTELSVELRAVFTYELSQLFNYHLSIPANKRDFQRGAAEMFESIPAGECWIFNKETKVETQTKTTENVKTSEEKKSPSISFSEAFNYFARFFRRLRLVPERLLMKYRTITPSEQMIGEWKGRYAGTGSGSVTNERLLTTEFTSQVWPGAKLQLLNRRVYRDNATRDIVHVKVLSQPYPWEDEVGGEGWVKLEGTSFSSALDNSKRVLVESELSELKTASIKAEFEKAVHIWRGAGVIYEKAPKNPREEAWVAFATITAKPGNFHELLVQTLDHPKAIVAGYCLLALSQTQSPALKNLSDTLLLRRDKIFLDSGTHRTSMELCAFARRLAEKSK